MAEPLTWNATRLPSGATDFRVKWLNRLDGVAWQPIDCRLVEMGAEWGVDRAPFSLRLPKLANGTAEFVSDCRWDIFNKTNITEASYSVRVTPIGVSLVTGVVDAATPDTLTFKNAYPFGDLLYVASHGRAPRFQKLIRINTLPTGTGPLRISFKLTHDAGRVEIADKALGNPMRDTIRQMQIDVSNELRKTNNDVKDLMRRQFAMSDLRKQPWLGARKIVTQPVSFHQQTANGRRGIGIKTAQVWDSSTPPKRETIQLEMVRETDGSVTLTKIIPRAFLNSATLPVMTDTVSTFYPDPDPETTSVDGYAVRGTGSDWASLVSGSGTSADDAGNLLVGATNAITLNNWKSLKRSIILWDTSSIGAGNLVSAVTSSLYVYSKIDDLGDLPNFNFYGATPAGNTSLASGDFQLTQSTEYATSLAYNSISLNSYNDRSLNASGIAATSLTGVSKFSVKNANFDVANSAPTWVLNDMLFQIAFRGAETSGTSQDPKLVVTHAPAFSYPQSERHVRGLCRGLATGM